MEDIIASPYLEQWEFDIIKNMLGKYNIKIHKSKLNDDIEY